MTTTQDEPRSALGPDDKVVLFMRQGCHVCARVKKFLTDNDVPFTLREVDQEPLTPRELWELFTKKASRLRVPFTVLNDGEDVVLGYDPLRLEGVLLQGDRGGWQISAPVVGERVYDDFAAAALDTDRWAVEGDPAAVTVGEGTLTIAGGATLRSVERFKTPPGSTVSVQFDLSVDGAADVAMTDTTSGLALGFRVDGGAVTAVHERRLLAGVTLPEETFRHLVTLDVDATPGATHSYRVQYQHDTNRVEWSVDGEVRYWATTPRPLEGCSLELHSTGRAALTAPILHG